MIGYKVINKNMMPIYGNPMIYKIKKEYSITGDLEYAVNGFHFSDSIIHAMEYSTKESDRYFKIDSLDGELDDTVASMYASSKLMLIEEISKNDMHKFIMDNYDDVVYNCEPYVRRVAAFYGIGLEDLIYDSIPMVRAAVAEKGYGIDKLISDSDYTVRSIALSKKNYYF